MLLIEAPASRLRRCAGLLAFASAALLSACATPPHRAPVEERSSSPRPAVIANAAAPSASAPVEAASAVVVDSNSGRPGYYTIKPGDTMIRIGLDSGQNWKDIVRWNNIANPNVLEVGQVLRIVAPGVDPGAATPRPVTTAKVETRALDAKPASAVGASAPSATPAPPPPPVTPREGDDDVAWGWPSTAPIAAPFDEARNKGLVFKGKPGDPVLAAADGRVVYAGSGLRGYGNLVILKHNATYLTAYAHNQTLLVKDDQAVKKGQKIAEMGSTDADSVQLHFEIRRQGKPIDPARLLPPR